MSLKMMRLVVAFGLFLACHSFTLPWHLPELFKHRPEWDALRVRWGLNLFNENNFRGLPRRESDAHDARYVLLSDECREIEQAEGQERRSRAKFLGKRYWKINDPSLILIYDVHGYIAGIQTAIPKRVLENEQMKLMGVQMREHPLLREKDDGEKIQGMIQRRRRQSPTFTTQEPSIPFITQTSTPPTTQEPLIPFITQPSTPPTTQEPLIPFITQPSTPLTTQEPLIPFITTQPSTPPTKPQPSTPPTTQEPLIPFITTQPSTPPTTPQPSTPSTTPPPPPTSTTPPTPSSTPQPSTTSTTPPPPTPSSTPQPSTPSTTPQPSTPTTTPRPTEIPHPSTPTAAPSATETPHPSTPTAAPRPTETPHPSTPTSALPATETPHPSTPTAALPATETPHPSTPTAALPATETPHPSTPTAALPATETPHPSTTSNTPYPITEDHEISVNSSQRKLKRPLHYPYVEDGDFIFFTVYFIEPERICSREHARFVDDFEHWGTGSGLFIQNGTDAGSYIQIPRDEVELRHEHWKAEKCFWTLGRIFSYNFHDDQDCQSQFPLLLNYNHGRLTGFSLLWKLDFSSCNLEHPDKGLLRFMFEKVPKCYYEMGRLTKLQFFFTNDYLSHQC